MDLCKAQQALLRASLVRFFEVPDASPGIIEAALEAGHSVGTGSSFGWSLASRHRYNKYTFHPALPSLIAVKGSKEKTVANSVPDTCPKPSSVRWARDLGISLVDVPLLDPVCMGLSYAEHWYDI